jgi:hypothetical protein
MPKRRRTRLTRKNSSTEQTLDISFKPKNSGVNVVAKYQNKAVIKTRFNKVLELEDMGQINDAFFLGYTFRQFKVDCPELSESCTGWTR